MANDMGLLSERRQEGRSLGGRAAHSWIELPAVK